MQTMFYYSIKKHVSYAQEKEKISYPVDFTVFHITCHIFICANCTTFGLPYALGLWDIFENLLNTLDKQLAINLKSLRVLVLAF